MTDLGTGEIIYELRKKIQEIQTRLDGLGEPATDIPEMIQSANLLRLNEYLSKANENKSELLIAYKQYSSALEELLSSVFDIQKDLKDILKEQSSLIVDSSNKTTKPKIKSKKK
ncbi:MAG: hypothetical protein OEW78_07110 [Nitrosopumilus sp.]|uniref:hypothetical protein n=1 Tax=Nitrosopumilus sp. TaxID=2024843 RepID=UPI00246F23C4|nr:hypothetical protein [Nitrosopumilus sp.]MDH5431634.1 hypothetical protein [Nitrosopumilus sp.]MDH5666175.1 hypothetical protein [Nitrosopumilus sp.]MDH5698050.1 hypothetical protein [Nitrosopumilus sp.]